MVFSIGTRKTAKNPNNKTESGNLEYSEIQTQFGKNMYKVK